MKPYQIMGIIACCTAFFAGLVTLMTMQGIHIVLAILGVYFLAVFVMLGMQRRAKESFEFMEELKLRKHQRNSLMSRTRAREVQRWGQYSTSV